MTILDKVNWNLDENGGGGWMLQKWYTYAYDNEELKEWQLSKFLMFTLDKLNLV